MYRPWVMMVAFLGLHGAASQAWAVKAATWAHEQPGEFTSAELKNLVVTSAGEVMLGRKTDTLYVPGEEAEVINALARAGDGKLYAATGPKGLIYRIDGDKVTPFATCPEAGTVFSLLFTRDGKLLAGTGGGEQAKIYLIDGTGEATLFYEPPDARYVWAMARGPQGEIYAATGVQGKLFVVDADGSNGKMLADLKPKNLLCLAFGPDGLLYGGTDEDGLVYRINPASGSSYVLYDAKEPEISAIVLDADGNIFAATAAADNARPGRAVADAPGGRPDHSDSKPAASQPATGTNPSDSNNGKPDNGEDDEEEPEEEEKPAVRAIIMPKRLGRSVAGAKKAKGGNAIYRIDIDGFVTEVFREPVMILAMAEHTGTIYAATGNEGRIYAITPDAEQTVVLAKLEPAQATALMRLPTGDLVLGTANEAKLIRMSNDYAANGTLVSEPLDAGQIVKWGRVVWEASVPEGTKLTVATRSGNVEDDESDAWEAWSGEMDATAPQQVSSAGARFLQYRLTFESTVPDASAALRKISIARIEENRPPGMRELKVRSASEAAKDPTCPPKVKALAARRLVGKSDDTPNPDYNWVVNWKAEDPNKDALEYEVFYRQRGHTRWIRMAKELKEPFHMWDTRTVPDGKYEVRVVARDDRSNPTGSRLSAARISDPVTIDNTAPEVTIGAVAVEGKDRLTVNASITDSATPIEAASYTVDSNDEWIPLAALDDIFDSPNESISFTIDDLTPGEHLIALRVSDRQGNTRYVTQSATIGE